MIQHSKMTSGFRPDINGLRAWAVLAVILFHFSVPGFAGGFVGVDVFFVISGFLMSSIVVGGLLRHDFSIRVFYLARARRIVPALVVLCAVLLLLGWWFLLPLDYRQLGKQVAASLFFLSNVEFWSEAGYFDAASHEKWLLHTWSLSVEWQFYLLLPVLVSSLWKYFPGRRPLLLCMLAGFLGSLALSVFLTPLKPGSAFYLLPTRAWEMLAGGLVYLLANRCPEGRWQGRLLEGAGLCLILVSIVLFDSVSAWPGWRAIWPVAGSVLVLLAARRDSGWTGNGLAQWLGSRSYSLYLWHWPVVVGLRYVEGGNAPGLIAACLLLTLLLGHLSYQRIESTMRQRTVPRARFIGVGGLLPAMLLIALMGGSVLFLDGIRGRFPVAIEQVADEALNKNPRADHCLLASGSVSPGCMSGGDQLKALLLGDSHANAVVSALALALPRSRDGVLEWSYRACPILQGIHSTQASQSGCPGFVGWALKQLAAIPPDIPVIVVNRHGQYALGQNEAATADKAPAFYFSRPYATAEPAFLQEYAQAMVSTACTLAKTHTVYLLRPIPEMGVHVPNTARAMVWGKRSDVSITLADYHARNAVFWAAQDAARVQCGVRILDPLPYLCDEVRCYGSRDGRPLYHDDDHLSEFGNRLLLPLFAGIFPAGRQQTQ